MKLCSSVYIDAHYQTLPGGGTILLLVSDIELQFYNAMLQVDEFESVIKFLWS